MNGPHPASSRCLHCHRQIAGVASSCLHCGRAVVGSLARVTWSLHPRFVGLEGTARTLVVVGGLTALFAVVNFMAFRDFSSVLWLFFVPCGTLASWMIVSQLRRWETTRLPRIFAALSFGLPGLFLLPRTLALLFGGEPWEPESWGVITLNVLEFAGLAAIWIWGTRVDEWKQREQREWQELPLPELATPLPATGGAAWTCLYCHRPVAQGRRCAACGHSDMPSLHRIYWTLDRRALRCEFAAKALVIALCVVLGVLMVPRTGSGTGGGWVIVFPAALAVALWETLSKITRHVPLFRARLFWSLVCWIAGGIVLLYLGALASGGASPTSGGFLSLGAAALGAILLGGIIWKFAPLLDRWKAHWRGTPRPVPAP